MRHHTANRQAGAAAIRRSSRHRWRRLLAGVVGVLGPGLFAATADATGSYPGETLSLALSGPAVAGQSTDFVATGQDTDVDDYAGGFDINVFAKDPSVDPTCAPSYWEESNDAISDPSEVRLVIGDWEGMDTSFSVPFKAVFSQPGPVLLCAYSDWITDTAASAQLSVDVAGPPSAPSPPVSPPASPPVSTPTTAPPGGGPPMNDRPLDRARPRVTRSGHSLRCSHGVWSNAPSGFSYLWVTSGRRIARAHGSRLTVSHSLRGHTVRCGVKATNAAGATTAVSRPFTVQ